MTILFEHRFKIHRFLFSLVSASVHILLMLPRVLASSINSTHNIFVMLEHKHNTLQSSRNYEPLAHEKTYFILIISFIIVSKTSMLLTIYTIRLPTS